MDLKPDQYIRFQNVVEPLVQTLSKMSRSASLSILYHLTDLSARGQEIPDLYHQKDTYWKNWLRFRADNGTIPVPGAVVVPPSIAAIDDEEGEEEEADDGLGGNELEGGDDSDEVPTDDAGLAVPVGEAAEDVREVRVILRVVGDHVGVTLLLSEVLPLSGEGLSSDPVRVRLRVADDDTVKVVIMMQDEVRRRHFAFGGETQRPELTRVFDQALAYAAHTLKTQVINNAYLTLIPTLTRLAKATLRATSWKSTTSDGKSVKTWHVMSKLRGKAGPEYEPGSQWHPDIVSFIEEARRRLGLSGDSFLFDDYMKPSKTRKFGQAFLFNRWMLERLRTLKQRGIKLSPVFSVARAHVRLDRKILTVVALRTFANSSKGSKLGKIVADYRALAALMVKKVIYDPAKLLPKRPKNAAEKPKARSGPAWEAWGEADEAITVEWRRDVLARKSEDGYVAMAARYDAYLESQTRLVSSLFAKGGSRRGWKFDGSMMTDGVSASIQYSKVKLVLKKPPADAATKSAKKMKNAETAAPTPDEGYAKRMSSLVTVKDFGKVLVAGLDPGQTDLASVTFCLDEDDRKLYPGAMHKGVRNPDKTRERRWSLSGSEYRHESGIKKEDRRKRLRFERLEKSWQEMGRTSSLKTLSVADIESYLRQYLEIEELWWSIALRRVESRANLKRYIGKRSVLDAFFAKVDSELQRLFPGTTVMLAYGSAGLAMGKTGKNRVAVPSTAVYQSASRIFGQRCCIQDEWGTTKTDFSTGEVKHAVYRLPGGKFGHTAAKWMPYAKEEHVKEVDELWTTSIKKNRKRRGRKEGRVDEEMPRDKKEEDYRRRYPEVRGLRYLPSTRTYFGRDASSAGCIARLAAYKLKNGAKTKPAPFCRSRKADESNETGGEEVQPIVV